jgi:hypothetical protein
MAEAVVKCPGCKRSLAASGELVVDGQTLGVYQCDTCIVPWQLEGEEFPAALTFALTPDGRILDSESLEAIDVSKIRRGESAN